ncbi:MAG: leucyl aminopeptidase [Actinomadura sp.]
MPIETRLTAVAEPVRQAALSAGADVLAVPVRPGPEVATEDLADLVDLLPVDPAELLAFHGVKGEPGEIVAVPIRLEVPAEPGTGDERRGRVGELLLYGVGDATPASLRGAAAAVTRRCRGRSTAVVAVPSGDLAAFAEGALLASYDFRIGAPGEKRALAEMLVHTAADDTAAALERGAVSARATALTRDLANMPSVDKCPAWLADRAREIAAESGLTVRIRDEGDLRAEGFGGLIAVGAGSARPPRLIELSYEPDEYSEHVVLVGKGITFDSGGLSLKPNENMKTMKSDMAGGAVVMAVMSALRSAGVRKRVTGLIAAAENMPSGSAMRPSDVITHFGGKTSEVLNTDAEGRLVLADALAYADTRLDPDVVVDIATLTGAAKIALGLRYGALFATDDALAAALSAAGEESGERLWRMPLVDDYRTAIDSDVADVANTGKGGVGGGAITAALFLREFAGERPWAHLDVAGPARAASDNGEISKGATGFGVRALLCFLAEPQSCV